MPGRPPRPPRRRPRSGRPVGGRSPPPGIRARSSGTRKSSASSWSRAALQSPVWTATAYSTVNGPWSCGPSTASSGPAGLGRSAISERDRYPVARNRVSASSVPSPTTSYSSSPSCSSAMPSSPSDASTNRRDTNVGSGASCGPALGRQPALDDRERALGVRRGHRARQGEVGAEAVVTAAVVQLRADPEERLAGAQLEGRDHLRQHLLVAAAGAHPLVADGMVRPPVPREHPELGAHRTVLVERDRHRFGAVDDEVGRGRRVVVGVTAVAALDEPTEPGRDDSGRGGDRVGARRRIDVHLAGARSPSSARRREGPWPGPRRRRPGTCATRSRARPRPGRRRHASVRA